MNLEQIQSIINVAVTSEYDYKKNCQQIYDFIINQQE